MAKAVMLKDNSSEKCDFCNTSLCDVVNLGEKFQMKDLVLHYYCVLLSYRTPQNGSDDDGLRGFLYNDIKEEVKRCENVSCEFCGYVGASMQCHKCKIKFHLPCGLVKNIMSQFKDEFRSYCEFHRPKQTLPAQVVQEARRNPPMCVICRESVLVEEPYHNALWAPCCQKNWYHRTCLQKLALSQASLFKCAVCSNSTKFKTWMVKYGIFIPERDAAWELEPNAFETLQERHSRCDVDDCLCPYGRTADREGSRWEIVLCQTCGSQGTHVRCSGLKFNCVDWECNDCATITGNTPPEEGEVPGPSTEKPPSSEQGESSLASTDPPISPPAQPKERQNKARRGKRFTPPDRGSRATRSATSSEGNEGERVERSRSTRAASHASSRSSRRASSSLQTSPSLSSSSGSDVAEENARRKGTDSAKGGRKKEDPATVRVKAEPRDSALELSNSGSGKASVPGPAAAGTSQTVPIKQESGGDWKCVRKQAQDSDSDTDVEVVEIEPPPPPVKKEPPATDTTPQAASARTPNPPPSLPLDHEGQPVKFIVIGGTLYEVAEGDGEQLTLKKQGPVLQPEFPKPEPPPVLPPPPEDYEIVESRAPQNSAWMLPPQPPPASTQFMCQQPLDQSLQQPLSPRRCQQPLAESVEQQPQPPIRRGHYQEPPAKSIEQQLLVQALLQPPPATRRVRNPQPLAESVQQQTPSLQTTEQQPPPLTRGIRLPAPTQLQQPPVQTHHQQVPTSSRRFRVPLESYNHQPSAQFLEQQPVAPSIQQPPAPPSRRFRLPLQSQNQQPPDHSMEQQPPVRFHSQQSSAPPGPQRSSPPLCPTGRSWVLYDAEASSPSRDLPQFSAPTSNVTTTPTLRVLPPSVLGSGTTQNNEASFFSAQQKMMSFFLTSGQNRPSTVVVPSSQLSGVRAATPENVATRQQPVKSSASSAVRPSTSSPGNLSGATTAIRLSPPRGQRPMGPRGAVVVRCSAPYSLRPPVPSSANAVRPLSSAPAPPNSPLRPCVRLGLRPASSSRVRPAAPSPVPTRDVDPLALPSSVPPEEPGVSSKPISEESSAADIETIDLSPPEVTGSPVPPEQDTPKRCHPPLTTPEKTSTKKRKKKKKKDDDDVCFIEERSPDKSSNPPTPSKSSEDKGVIEIE